MLIAEAVDGDDEGHGGGHDGTAAATHPASTKPTQRRNRWLHSADAVRGLAVAQTACSSSSTTTELPRGNGEQAELPVVGADGDAITDFDVEHDEARCT